MVRIADVDKMADGPMKRRLLAQLADEKPDITTVTSPPVKKRKNKAPKINEGEEVFWQQLQDAKLDGWHRQYKFDPNREYRADFCHPELKLIVEIDGGVYTGGAHGSVSGILKGMERANAATMLGYRILRFLPNQVTHEVTAIEMIKDFYRRNPAAPAEGLRLIPLSEWCRKQRGRYRNTGNARHAIAAGKLPGARKVDQGGEAGLTWMVPEFAEIAPSPNDPYGSRGKRTDEGLAL